MVLYFKGKYKGIIGLGSTLKDVQQLVGNYVNVYDTYEMINDKGICFELADIDNWSELTAPIDLYLFFELKNRKKARYKRTDTMQKDLSFPLKI